VGGAPEACDRVIPGFFSLAVGLSWLAWFPLAAHALGFWSQPPSPYLHLLGGLGPAAAAVIVSGREGTLDRLWQRMVRVRGQGKWILLAVLAPVFLYALAAAGLALAGAPVDLRGIGRSAEYSELGRATFIVANIVAYGLGEEVGWRGYALPRLQTHRTALRSTVLLAVVWAFWHLPLFSFSEGMRAMGPAAATGWLASIFSGAFLMSWVFNASGGSVWAVALFHGVLDVLINAPSEGPLQMVMGALVTVCGLLVPFVFGARDLSSKPRVTDDAGLIRENQSG